MRPNASRKQVALTFDDGPYICMTSSTTVHADRHRPKAARRRTQAGECDGCVDQPAIDSDPSVTFFFNGSTSLLLDACADGQTTYERSLGACRADLRQYDCIYDLADQIQATYKAGHVIGAFTGVLLGALTRRRQPRLGAPRLDQALERATEEQHPEGRHCHHQDHWRQSCTVAATVRLVQQQQHQGCEEPWLRAGLLQRPG